MRKHDSYALAGAIAQRVHNQSTPPIQEQVGARYNGLVSGRTDGASEGACGLERVDVGQ